MQDEKVLKEVNKQPHCVTEHPGFVEVCLNRWSLELAARSFKTREGPVYRQTGSDERLVFCHSTSIRVLDAVSVWYVRSLLSAALICHGLVMTITFVVVVDRPLKKTYVYITLFIVKI